jgi:hypothetical protein
MTGHTRANAFDDPDLLRKKSGMQGEDFDCTSLFKYDIALIDPQREHLAWWSTKAAAEIYSLNASS